MTGSSGLVSGRFRLGELLGTGGSASVFAAVDASTGDTVALKVLHPHLSERPIAREAFLAEARRAQPLRHPNIVRVRGVGVDVEAPLAWIALDLAEGSSLSEHVARYGPLSPSEAAAVLDGTLRALEAAHAIGIVHRDVSPANIMVAPGVSGLLDPGGVRLLDFGLASAAGKAALGTDELLSVEANGRAGVMGNVNYMSPEQVRGAPVDARGDVYQAGAVLYFALTGRPPFPRSAAGQTMRAHLESPPPVPSVIDPRIPRALDRVVVRAMLKEPADRFPSAEAMRAVVAESGVGATAVAASVSAPAPAVESAAVESTAVESAPVDDLVFEKPAVDIPSPGETAITRVLGRTMVPPRISGAAVPSAVRAGAAQRSKRSARRIRSRVGAWFAAAAGAAVITLVVVGAASSTPTTAAAPAEPSASAPPEAPAQVEPAVQSEPEPEPELEPEPEPVEVIDLLTIPDLTRFTLAEAERALADAGFAVGEIRRIDSPLPVDSVLESSPAPGRQLAAGGAVALVVASGFHTIPDVVGQSRDAAAATMQSAGFAPSFVRRTAVAGTAAGAILGTEPGRGSVVAVGATITILEAAPSATPTPTPVRVTPTPAPSSTATSTPTPVPTTVAGD